LIKERFHEKNQTALAKGYGFTQKN